MFELENLPESIETSLLHCGTGYLHLSQLAQAILEKLGRSWPGDRRKGMLLAADCLLAAWENNPLDAKLAANILRLQAQGRFLGPAQAQLLHSCAGQPAPDRETITKLRPRNYPGDETYRHILEEEAKNGAFPFFALEHALNFAFSKNEAAWVRRLIDDKTRVPPPLHSAFKADAEFALGEYASAAANYAHAFQQVPFLTWEVRRAECLYRLGKCGEALALWQAAAVGRPWQINILLRLTDVLLGRDKTNTPFPPGRGAVLLYTWNKAQEMDETLAGLAETELEAENGSARIFALDNGSTDATPAVYKKWVEHFDGRMSVVTLPVNIGAPAARNWLLSLPEVRNADWAAFLDDDVSIPRPWLRQLWAGLSAYPEAGVCGGHAVDYAAPMRQQWTDMQLVTQNDIAWSGRSRISTHFDFTNPHEQCFNFGEFDFIRPAVTVIGCCHMFNRKALDALDGGRNGFDVRFSPSQSDDVDLDMRGWLAGRPSIFQGHLSVRHKRNSGSGRRSLRSQTSAVCNWSKLQGSYSAEEIQRLAESNRKALLEDLAMRKELLQKKFPGVPR